jgi:hypothetical protein
VNRAFDRRAFASASAGEMPDNRPLDAALVRVAESETPDRRAAFFHTLLGARLLVPVASESNRPAGFETIGWGPHESRRLICVRNDADEIALLAFTGPHALHDWRPDGCACVILDVERLLSIAVDHVYDAIVLNLASPASWEIDRAEFTALAGGWIPLTTEPGAHEGRLTAGGIVAAAAPAAPPSPALVHAVCGLLADMNEVVRAYFFDLRESGGPPQRTLGLELAGRVRDERRREIVDAIGRRASAALAEAEHLDVAVLDSSALSDQVRRVVTPFFPPT